MRMSELSSRSGVAVPTIKFYLREGLLPAGERLHPNQSSYTDAHVERLRLVRALGDVGGLPIAAIVAVLAAVDDPEMPLAWKFWIAQRAISRSLLEPVELSGRTTPPVEATSPDAVVAGPGREAVEKLRTELGWTVDDNNPGRAMAVTVLDAYAQLGHEELFTVLPEYARAALIVAGADLDTVALQSAAPSMAEVVVVGTVLGDGLFAGLRRMAQEHVSRVRY